MPVVAIPVDRPAEGLAQEDSASWSYAPAFSRNLGLINRQQQEQLRTTRVAIAGMGGVGGVHTTTLARLGVGRFTIADADTFELANFNRQQGASVSTLGLNKAEAMAAQARDINPESKITVFPERIHEQNVAQFLDGADFFIDGIDFFAMGARRLLFAEARRRGIWAITAGPIGYSTAWLVFAPTGKSFDDYFDLGDDMPLLDQLVAFLIGLTPRATQLAYQLDLAHPDVNIRSRRGPSLGLACQLSAGVVAAEVVKILFAPQRVRAAPYYQQFDPFVGRLVQGRLWRCNRNPWQRLKRAVLRRRLKSLGIADHVDDCP